MSPWASAMNATPFITLRACCFCSVMIKKTISVMATTKAKQLRRGKQAPFFLIASLAAVSAIFLKVGGKRRENTSPAEVLELPFEDKAKLDADKAVRLLEEVSERDMLSLPSLRTRQLLNMATRSLSLQDNRVNFLIGLLGTYDLCLPVCPDAQPYTQGFLSVLGQSLDEYPCPSSTVFSHFFKKQCRCNRSNQLLVAFNGDLSNLKSLIGTWKRIPACSSVTKVDLILLGFDEDVRDLVGGFNLLQSCFRKVFFLPAFSGTASGANRDTALFLKLMHQTRLIQNYNYLFWMGESLLPNASNWVQFLEAETNDASPYLWKSSLHPLQDVHSYLQRLYGFMPTGHTLRLNKHAFIGIWHEGFVNFLTTLLKASKDSSSSFESIFSSFLFQRKCHFKFFMHHIRYSSFSGPAVVTNNRGRTFVDLRQKKCPQVGLNSNPADYSYWFSRKESNQPLTYSELNNLVWETGHMASGTSTYDFYSWKKNGTKYVLSKKEKEVKDLMANDCLIPTKSNPPSSNLQQTGKIKKPRILVTIVFYKKQYSALLYSLARWEYKDLYPCSQIGKKEFAAGFMFLQSDLESDLIAPEKIKKDTKNYASLSACFDRVHYKSIAIPVDDYYYGPPNMFKEFMLGSVSKQYDYVFQMEPDVLPIKVHWLHKLYAETQDNSPFWVKGSFAMYYDHHESYGGCLTGRAINRTHATESFPIGPRFLHINGNALYSLGTDFKEVLQEFFEWSKTSSGCMCSKDDRMTCSNAGLCRGSFDVSLAEFILLTAENMERAWPYYRGSNFIMNSMDPDFMPLSIPENAYFLHKPWHFLKDKKSNWQHKLQGTLLSNELEIYLHNGFPPEDLIQKKSQGNKARDPNANLKFVKDTFDRL